MFGSGPAWAAALEAALLLKEVSGIPAEGVETREGATSAMMALAARSARAQPPGRRPRIRCSTRRRRSAPAGARRVLRAPAGGTADRRLAAVTTFPAAAALAPRLGVARGLDVDQPAWTDAYYRVARRTA